MITDLGLRCTFPLPADMLSLFSVRETLKKEGFFSWFQWLVFQVLAMQVAFMVLVAYSGLASEAIQLLQCLASTVHSSQQISLASSRGNFVAEYFSHELHSLAP